MTGPERRSTHKIAAVIIGRNEGARLVESIQSVRAVKLPIVYSDSGSTDGSPQVAREMGLPVVELDPPIPFSAGRGRNEGLNEALRCWPEIQYVLFLDGDCSLDPQFPSAAVRVFDERPECAIVTGHLTERFPDRSVYNRLCAIEWRSPAGLMTNLNGLGGIMVARISAFAAAGGFNLNAIAGEEPDLGARLITTGYTIIKIDAPMATHDAHMLKFSQWWKRGVRGGHALAYRYSQLGRARFPEGLRELVSDFFWGLGLPTLALVLLWFTRGLSVLVLAAYPLFVWRIYKRYRADGVSAADARLVALFIVIGKFAHVAGITTFCRNWMRGEFRIIEYK